MNTSNNFFQLATKGRNEWGNYLITIFLVVIGYILGQVPLSLIQLTRIEQMNLGTEALEEFATTMDFSIFGMDKNFGLFLMILLFAFATAGLYLGLRIQGKKFKDIITPSKSINWNKILFGFAIWFGLTVLFEILFYFMNPEGYTLQFQPGKFFVLLIICILFLPIQTSFEEFFFRGYLMQGISLLSKNKWVPLIITTILFALVHGTNPEIEKYGFWTMQVYYIAAGLLLGIVVIMDDGLELALGMHAATNFYGATMVTYEGSVLQTDSIMKSTMIDPWLLNLFFIIMSVTFLIICFKKYNWKPLTYIFEPIDQINDSILEENMTPTKSQNIIKTNSLETNSDQTIVSNTDYTRLINDESE